MMRRAVTAAICAACRRTSSYVIRLKGPISPGRWQVAQRFQMIGAISLAKVSFDCGCAADTEVIENTERISHGDTKTQSKPFSLCLGVSVAEALRELCRLCALMIRAMLR